MPIASDAMHPPVLKDSIVVRLLFGRFQVTKRMETSQVSSRKLSRIIAPSF